LPAISFKVESEQQIAALAPPGFGTVNVTVKTPAGTSAITPGDQFTYVAAPVVSSVGPQFLNPGQSTTITGTGFINVSAVHFGAAPAAIASSSQTQLVVVVPQGSGTVDVTVTAVGGTSAINANDKFTYVTFE
jgi:hypothetical protein